MKTNRATSATVSNRAHVDATSTGDEKMILMGTVAFQRHLLQYGAEDAATLVPDLLGPNLVPVRRYRPDIATSQMGSC